MGGDRPAAAPPARLGRWEKHPRREIVNAIFYVLRTGCAWRYLPTNFPPWQTVFWYFARWEQDGTAEVVRKQPGQHTFQVLPRRWVVERSLAWITRCRRLDPP